MLPTRLHATAVGAVLCAAVALGATHAGHRAAPAAVGPASPVAGMAATAAGAVARPPARVAVPAASRSQRHATPPSRHRHRRHHHHRRAHRRHHRHHFHHRHHRHHRHQRLAPARQVQRVLRVARDLRGHPYVWGAAGPHAFDCSGFVQFVFRRALGRQLPKYTDTQYAVLRHIHRHALRRGDLVFVGWPHHHKWHVGIYAGHGTWWDAPHTGSHVQKQRVWGPVHSYARVIRR